MPNLTVSWNAKIRLNPKSQRRKNRVIVNVRTTSGKVNYVGVAKEGRVQQRLEEHLPDGKDYIPGAKVQIEQVSSIGQAEKNEAAAIKRIQLKYNEQGK